MGRWQVEVWDITSLNSVYGASLRAALTTLTRGRLIDTGYDTCKDEMRALTTTTTTTTRFRFTRVFARFLQPSWYLRVPLEQECDKRAPKMKRRKMKKERSGGFGAS